ncbi:MAG: hypothetical protein GY771_02080 [bacterium]|nr:hypothetical protein [bacterium]
MRYVFLTALIGSAILIAGCSQTRSGDGSDIDYPYYAPQERRDTIENGCGELRLGMYADELKGTLGEPDEINDTYRPEDKVAKSPKPIGYSYVYLIQRLQAKGSAAEKDEILLRLHFDPEDKLTRIDRAGF